MALRSCSSTRAGAWIANSELPWHQLVALGPSGFEAYARLRFLSDPLYNGQPEIALADAEALSEHELVRATLDVLRHHTTTPDDVYFCLWDGWGPRMYPPSMLNGPRVRIPDRDYFMLHGALSDFETWSSAELAQGLSRSGLPDPAFIWPSDHAWCLAHDVDPHYAGIGATSTAVGKLLDHPSLDIVPTDLDGEQPYYH